ncbi:MAG: hypothetical protein QXM43_02130 [Desulfurococcaceae archaeon]
MTKVYIVVPSNVYTGGPTALFSLCHSLVKYFNVDAIIAFTGIKKGLDPVHPNYKKYKCKWIPISKVKDNPKDLLIVPETQTNLLERFKALRKAIYWLSIDNFFLSIHHSSKVSRIASRISFYRDYLIYSLRYCSIPNKMILNDVRYYIACKEISNAINNANKILSFLDNVDLHIAQSLYAKNFLTNLGINKNKVLLVREPIEEEFLNAHIDFQKKDDIITFNARKAFSIIYRLFSKVKQLDSNVKVIPLMNVGKERMVRILSKSKVFIDIGHHPGRDRPFREAGVLGNIVIVNRSGGYYYFDDCPIPDEYTIKCYSMACKDLNIEHLSKLIVDCIKNYECHISNFQKFREYVLNEPKLYFEDLRRLVHAMLEW